MRPIPLKQTSPELDGTFSAPARHLPEKFTKETTLMLSTILIVLLILMLIGALPAWPHSAGWGYGPGGGLGLILIIVVILALMGRI
jgi:hypothetical protein